jgi:hypothetical protein
VGVKTAGIRWQTATTATQQLAALTHLKERELAPAVDTDVCGRVDAATVLVAGRARDAAGIGSPLTDPDALRACVGRDREVDLHPLRPAGGGGRGNRHVALPRTAPLVVRREALMIAGALARTSTKPSYGLLACRYRPSPANPRLMISLG